MEALAKPSQANQPGSTDWVERLFLRFQTMYGSLWIDRWRDAPMPLVKAEWKEALSRFDLPTIKLALDWCGEHQKFPPTLPEFIVACKDARPRPEAAERQNVPRLSVDSRVAREKIAELVAQLKTKRSDPLNCFRQILIEADAGTYTYALGIQYAKEALGLAKAKD